jgi:hypothetical protein
MSMPSPMSMAIPIMPSMTRIMANTVSIPMMMTTPNDCTNDLRLQSLLFLLQVTELRNQLPKFSYIYTWKYILYFKNVGIIITFYLLGCSYSVFSSVSWKCIIFNSPT